MGVEYHMMGPRPPLWVSHSWTGCWVGRPASLIDPGPSSRVRQTLRQGLALTSFVITSTNFRAIRQPTEQSQT